MTDPVSNFAGTMSELTKNDAAVEDVKTALNTILGIFDDSDFKYMATIQEQSFGDTSAATTLAFHHGLAHQVMLETLTGIQNEIQAFLTNVNKSAEMIDQTDQDSASAIAKKQEAVVSAFDSYDAQVHDDAANHHARNNQHDPWDAPAGTTTDGSAR